MFQSNNFLFNLLGVGFFAFSCMCLINCGLSENPCSLPQNVRANIREVDSIINTPGFKEQMIDYNREKYNEPALFDVEIESYRLKISPIFEQPGNTRFFRIQKEGGIYKSLVKEFHGNTSELIFSDETEITEEVWNSITERLDNNDFWYYKCQDGDPFLFSSMSWAIEGFNPKFNWCTFQNYHGVSRINLRDSIFKSMCEPFLQLREGASLY